MNCEQCTREAQLHEPFWTSRKTGKCLTVCANCLYKLDGIDYRGKSCADVLRNIEKCRRR